MSDTGTAATAPTNTDPNTTGTAATATNVDTTLADALADAAKWKGLAQKHEERAKTNAEKAKDYDTLKQQTMTELERQVAEAKQAGINEAKATFGQRLAAERVRLLATGRGLDVDALLEVADLSKLCDADGEPDNKAITAWVEKLAPKATEENTGTRSFDLGQGARPSNTALNGDPLLRDLKMKVGLQP